MRTDGYRAAHKRVERRYGPATGYQCISCPSRAAEWAYDGSDPYEMTDERGRRFSDDPDRYWPRCRSCHRRADARQRQRTEHADEWQTYGHSTARPRTTPAKCCNSTAGSCEAKHDATGVRCCDACDH